MPPVRVLLADDHKEMLKYVRALLSSDFDVVAAVADGQAALKAAIQFHPEVAVLDISMPVLDGIETAKRLREADANIKIVFLTVDRDPDLFLALENVALGYVLKPRLGTDLIPAVKLAATGCRFVSPGLK